MKVFALVILAFCLVENTRGGVPGGENPVDVNSPDVTRLTEIALGHLNSKKGLTETKAELVEVLEATVQVVSGSLTKLTLKVADNGTHMKCVVKIWEQPWLNKTEITDSTCEEFKES